MRWGRLEGTSSSEINLPVAGEELSLFQSLLDGTEDGCERLAPSRVMVTSARRSQQPRGARRDGRGMGLAEREACFRLGQIQWGYLTISTTHSPTGDRLTPPGL